MENLGVGFWVFEVVLIVLFIVAGWKVFAKAGKPGWASIVPIYNIIVLLEIIGRPVWWIVLFLVPLVNIVVSFIIVFDLAKSFGKGSGFGLGLIFLAPIFYLILAFSDAEYVGPAASMPPNNYEN